MKGYVDFLSLLRTNLFKIGKRMSEASFFNVHYIFIFILCKAKSIDLSRYQKKNIKDYSSFQDFFCRELSEETKNKVNLLNSMELCMPCDGRMGAHGEIKENTLLQAKGVEYSIFRLFGFNNEMTQGYNGGRFANIYLAPEDYHRIHMPFDGFLINTIYCPGDFKSVREKNVKNDKELYVGNERLICEFMTEHGRMSVIFVGAFMVGGIVTAWGGKVNYNRLYTHESFYNDCLFYKKGEEIGYFTMGSTVIVLFDSCWDLDFSSVNQGDRVEFSDAFVTVMKK